MSYIGNQPSGQGQAERFIFTATGTTPTITHDDDGLPISYEENHVSVYLNGIKQVIPTDVAASNGSTLVFAANLVVGDIVECISLSSFQPSDTVSASSGGTFSGAVTHSGTVTNSSTTTATGLITANGGIETDTNSKVVQKGAFMQSSTHQALTLGG